MREVRSCVLEYRESFKLKETVLLIARPFPSVTVSLWKMSQLVQCSVPWRNDRVRELGGHGKIEDTET